MKTLNSIIGALVAIGALGFSASSQAATSYRVAVNHAAAACTGSTQLDRNMTRARAMGLANIKDGVSEVNCGGVSTPFNNSGDVEIFEAALRNSSRESVDVSCMLEDGVEDGATTIATKYPKTVTIAAGAVGWVNWSTFDSGGSNFRFPALICQLPRNVAISYTAVIYQEDVGL